MAPCGILLGGDYTTSPKDMLVLSVVGTKDFNAFKKANTKYYKGFTGYFDQYQYSRDGHGRLGVPGVPFLSEFWENSSIFHIFWSTPPAHCFE